MHLQQNKLYSFLTGMLPKLRITFYYFYGFTMNIYAFDVSELKKRLVNLSRVYTFQALQISGDHKES